MLRCAEINTREYFQFSRRANARKFIRAKIYTNKVDFFNKKVEKKIEFECSEMCDNKGFSRLFQQNLFIMVEKILNSNVLKCTRMKDFQNISAKCLLCVIVQKMFIPPPPKKNRAKIFRPPTKRA